VRLIGPLACSETEKNIFWNKIWKKSLKDGKINARTMKITLERVRMSSELIA